MKEFIIVSSTLDYIKRIENYLEKFKGNEIVMMESLFAKENKLGIIYKDNFDLFKQVSIPLKYCFKLYKIEYFENMCLDVNRNIITKFINLNLTREFELCFEKVRYSNRLYLDSIFRFLTREIEFSWDKIGEILRENNNIFLNKKQNKNIIKFKNNNTQSKNK